MRSAAVAAMLLTTACVSDPTTPPRTLARLELRHSSRAVFVNAQEKLSVTAFDDGNRVMKTPELTWSSSDTSIVTIDRFGLMTGLRIGQVFITASSGGIASSIGLDVRAARIRISAQSGPQDLLVGDTAVLRGEFMDVNGDPIATDMPIRWSSGELSVLSLEPLPGHAGQRVKVTALATGLALVIGSADGAEGAYVTAVVSAAVATPPIEVTDFHFVEYSTLDDFPAFVPYVRLRVVSDHEVNLVRAEAALEGRGPRFPALCGTISLPAGEHEVLGIRSYPSNFFAVGGFWSPTWPPASTGVAMLTYKDETGAVTSIAVRGAVRSWSGNYITNARAPWQLCP